MGKMKLYWLQFLACECSARLVLCLRRSIQIIALMGLILSSAAPGHTYFMDFIDGARPAGMGEAFVAVADDANAVLFNPAGLSRLTAMELIGMYADLYSNLNVRLYNNADDRFGYNFLSLAVPISGIYGTMGISWTQFDTVLYKENTFTMSYGKNLWKPYTLDSGLTIDFGMTAKVLHWIVDVGDEFRDDFPSDDRQRYGFTVDAGILVTLLENLNIGFAVDNIIPANVGLVCDEYVPAIYRLGAAYTLHLNKNIAMLDSVLATGELSMRNNVYLPKFGVESWWLENIAAIRLGINTDRATAGMSIKNWWNTGSVDMQLDYAFSYPFQIQGSLGSHRVGMILRWGSLLNRTDSDWRKYKDKILRITEVTLMANMAIETSENTKDEVAKAWEGLTGKDPETAIRMKEVLDRQQGLLGKARLQATVAVYKAESGSQNLKEKAGRAEQSVEEAWQVFAELNEKFDQLVRELEMKNVQIETQKNIIPVIPEKYIDRIIIGIETKIGEDFLGRSDFLQKIQYIKDYLEKQCGMPVELDYAGAAELQLNYTDGKIDIIASYNAELDQYIEHQLLLPVLTVVTDGKKDQACCLVTLPDSRINVLEDLKGKRIGCANVKVVKQLKKQFADDDYFTIIEVQRNIRDSLRALQVKAVDAIIEYEFIYKIAGFMADFPKLKEIARFESKPNISIYLRTSMSNVKNQAIQNLMNSAVEMHQEPEIRRILKYFGIERLER
ncbi:PhnD/SsuA/transferrin family substrate-binding protein [bacterium]|nr:PhnD/SsuA/transferrin family substrate-binding protein [bacterium]